MSDACRVEKNATPRKLAHQERSGLASTYAATPVAGSSSTSAASSQLPPQQPQPARQPPGASGAMPPINPVFQRGGGPKAAAPLPPPRQGRDQEPEQDAPLTDLTAGNHPADKGMQPGKQDSQSASRSTSEIAVRLILQQHWTQFSASLPSLRC